MVGGDHKQVTLPHTRQEVDQKTVELSGGGSVACHIAAVAVEHIKVHQIHESQTLKIPGLQGLGKGDAVGVAGGGQEYTLVADESAAYMEKVGALVDERMRQVLDALHVSQTDAAVLAAVNLADELLKNQAAAENLRRQVKNYLDEATQAKNEASELKRQLFKAQQGRGQ